MVHILLTIVIMHYIFLIYFGIVGGNLVSNSVVGIFWLNRVRLPSAVLDPNILSKGVETGPTTNQFGLACA